MKISRSMIGFFDVESHTPRGCIILDHRTIGERGIWCSVCEMVSFNANDVEKQYCAHCHVFHTDAPPFPMEKS